MLQAAIDEWVAADEGVMTTPFGDGYIAAENRYLKAAVALRSLATP